jgi:YVTN family beta-propeller protein
MKNFILLVTCHFILVTVSSAQWLEATIPVGDNPWALVYNSTDDKIYCANVYGNNVTVIDKYNSVIKTIPVGVEPNALVYNSINNKVYCANQVSNTVTVIDGATDSIITTITVGDGPIAFTWNPIQNRTYVANYWSNTVSVIKDTIIIGIEETTNLNYVNLTSEIYPNPVKSVMRVRVPLSVKEIKIFDVSGKLVKVVDDFTSAQGHKQEMIISLKGISPGIYFLRFGKQTKKFLVVK